MPRCHTFKIAWSKYSKSIASIVQLTQTGGDMNPQLSKGFALAINIEEKKRNGVPLTG